MKNLFTALLLSVCLTGCATRDEAKSEFASQLKSENWTPFSPPRLGDGIGTIITFDRSGREILVAAAETCFPTMAAPLPQRTAILDSTSEHVMSGKFSAETSETLKNFTNLSLNAASENGITTSLKFGQPFIINGQSILLKEIIRKEPKGSRCYDAFYDPKNLIVLSILGATSAEYTFLDNSNHSVILTAEFMKKLNLKPELRDKNVGKATLVIDQTMNIGYRALEARYLPGGLSDRFSFTELSAEDIAKYKGR